MNSFISLLWQYEINNCPITTTILKNQQQKPHHYFYSQKQYRVLRKKNPNILQLLQQHQNIKKQQTKQQQANIATKNTHNHSHNHNHNHNHKQKQKQKNTIKNKSNLLKISRNIKQNTICVQLCQYVMAMNDVSTQQYQGQYAIIQSNLQICLCTYTTHVRKHPQQNIQIQYLTCQQPSKTHLNHKTIQQSINQFVKQISTNLIMGIGRKIQQTKTKPIKIYHDSNNSNRVMELALLLAVDIYGYGDGDGDGGDNQIYIIDAVKLILQKPQYNTLNIMYNPINKNIISQHSIQPQTKTIHIKQIQKQPQKNELPSNKTNPISYTEIPPNADTNSEIDTNKPIVGIVPMGIRIGQQQNGSRNKNKNKNKIVLKQCICCDNSIQDQQQCKQVSNQQFKSIRRYKNMSIRGFNQPYYQICIKCYNSL